MLSLLAPSLANARGFLRDERAVSAVEFALTMPIVLTLLMGGFELANYTRATLRVEVAANSIAEMISQSNANPSATVQGNGMVSGAQLHFFYDSTMFTLPDALVEATQRGVDWSTLTHVAFWSVEFLPTPTGCTSNCSYTPVVVWSFNGGPACGAKINQVPDDTVITPNVLPASVYGPGSLIVVQVKYDYYPTFGAQLFGASTITRTAFMQPRNVPLVESSDTAENAGNCPGTP